LNCQKTKLARSISFYTSLFGHAIVAESKIGPFLNVIELTISQRLVNLILNYAYGHAIVVEFKIGPYLNVTELQISQELVNLIAI